MTIITTVGELQKELKGLQRDTPIAVAVPEERQTAVGENFTVGKSGLCNEMKLAVGVERTGDAAKVWIIGVN